MVLYYLTISGLMEAKIESWITPDPAVVDAEESLAIAIRLMARKQIGAILVVQNARLAGIFTERDLLRLFSGNSEKALEEHSARPIRRCSIAARAGSVSRPSSLDARVTKSR